MGRMSMPHWILVGEHPVDTGQRLRVNPREESMGTDVSLNL